MDRFATLNQAELLAVSEPDGRVRYQVRSKLVRACKQRLTVVGESNESDFMSLASRVIGCLSIWRTLCKVALTTIEVISICVVSAQAEFSSYPRNTLVKLEPNFTKFL